MLKEKKRRKILKNFVEVVSFESKPENRCLSLSAQSFACMDYRIIIPHKHTVRGRVTKLSLSFPFPVYLNNFLYPIFILSSFTSLSSFQNVVNLFALPFPAGGFIFQFCVLLPSRPFEHLQRHHRQISWFRSQWFLLLRRWCIDRPL